MATINVENLSTIYQTSKGDVHALDDVSFSLNNGESIGIAGESACGKSTLGLSIIRMLMGGKTISGKINLDNESILDLSEKEFDKRLRWKKIAMVFQGAMNSLDPVFTIKKQFVEVLKQHKFKGNFENVIADALNSVSLTEDVLKKYPHELSGGMKQRIAIGVGIGISFGAGIGTKLDAKAKKKN